MSDAHDPAPRPRAPRSEDPPPGFFAHLKWSLALLCGSLVLAAVAIPVLRLLGFMD